MAADHPLGDATTLDIVTVTYNSPPLDQAFQELASTPGWNLFVIDNASTTVPTLPPKAHLVENPANIGFGAACNQALQLGSAPHILFLNPDCVIAASSVHALLEVAAEAGSAGAVVGPRTTGHPGQKVLPAGGEPGAGAFLRQYCGVASHFGGGFNAYEATTARRTLQVDWVGGGCLLITRELFLQLGGFSPRYFMYGEDVDLCLRARDVGAQVLLAGAILAHHPVGTGSPANAALRMAWLRNLRTIVEARHGTAARRRLDGALLFGAAQVTLLKLTGREPSTGRPDLAMLRRYVFNAATEGGL